MLNNRLIREGRFGPPKSFKTGAVVGTYPKPMLVFEFDPDGLSVVREPIVFIRADELAKYTAMKKEELPPILAIDFSVINKTDLNTNYSPTPDKDTFPQVINALNAVNRSCPWNTVVLDTVTGLSDCIYGHQAATNAAALIDARKWAGNIGMKVKDVVSRVVTFPCHVVVLMHSEIEKNELTSEIRELPMIYSKVKEMISALFSQFFYATIESGKPVLKTKSKLKLTSIGPRFPANLPETCQPDYKSIYETEYK